LANVVAIIPLHKVALFEPGSGNITHNTLPVPKKLVAADNFVSYNQIFARKAPAMVRAHAQNAKCARAQSKFECSFIVKL
jgi:hypothetical protein